MNDVVDFWAVDNLKMTDIERELLYLIIPPYGQIRPSVFYHFGLMVKNSAFRFSYHLAFRIWPNGPVRLRKH